MTTITLNARELATVLAALRYWEAKQCQARIGLEEATALAVIASDGGQFDPLDAPAIDALCERINTAPAAPSYETLHAFAKRFADGTTNEAAWNALTDIERADWYSFEEWESNIGDDDLCTTAADYDDAIEEAQAIFGLPVAVPVPGGMSEATEEN
jgi:hypothetical protein